MEELRVPHHPVLGDAPTRREVTIYYNGQPIAAKEGEPIGRGIAGRRYPRVPQNRPSS